MLKFIWKILPSNYKFSVLFKKMGMMAGKATAGWLLGTTVGKHLSPQHIELISGAIGVITTAGLEAGHDWAKLKWPNNKYL